MPMAIALNRKLYRFKDVNFDLSDKQRRPRKFVDQQLQTHLDVENTQYRKWGIEKGKSDSKTHAKFCEILKNPKSFLHQILTVDLYISQSIQIQANLQLRPPDQIASKNRRCYPILHIYLFTSTCFCLAALRFLRRCTQMA